MDATETMGIGWLFAPVIGAWGLASLAISASGNSETGKRAFIRLAPAFFLLYVGCGYGLWMATKYGFDSMYWWVQFVLMFAPTALATTIAALSFHAKQKLGFLTNKPASNALASTIVVVPVLFAIISWVFWTIIS
jgi:hypothetical protein